MLANWVLLQLGEEREPLHGAKHDSQRRHDRIRQIWSGIPDTINYGSKENIAGILKRSYVCHCRTVPGLTLLRYPVFCYRELQSPELVERQFLFFKGRGGGFSIADKGTFLISSLMTLLQSFLSVNDRESMGDGGLYTGNTFCTTVSTQGRAVQKNIY